MPPTTLERLGFDPNDRVVILHADDIGMCQATLTAFENLIRFGLTSSYAIMAPCPWASAALEIAAQHDADVGVHVTLTSEWPHYRWRPLSTVDPSSGLLDAEGFMPRESEPVRSSAQPEAARLEMRAQFRFFTERGVTPTHMDSHMVTALHTSLLSEYVRAALEHDTPAMFPSTPSTEFVWMDEESVALAKTLAPGLATRGFPTVDQATGMPLSRDPDSRDDDFAVRLETARKVLRQLKPGLTHFAFHPAVDTPELRSICPDWRSRVGDEKVFRSAELKAMLEGWGVKVIGYRPLKHLIEA